MEMVIHSFGLRGIEPRGVEVRVGKADNSTNFAMIGMPDGAVRECRVRVLHSIRHTFPAFDGRPFTGYMITLRSDLPRHDGTAYDLPIALGMLAQDGLLSDAAKANLDRFVIVGELALEGEVRNVRGVMMAAEYAKSVGKALICSILNAEECRAVEGVEVFRVANLVQAVEHLEGKRVIQSMLSIALTETPFNCSFEMADVGGQGAAKRAMEIAAAGGHNLILVGPPGSGKTMLAKRMLGILPAPTTSESIATTRVYSAAGLMDGRALVAGRPFRAPHHTISDVGMIGGGAGLARPGELSLSHNGVLFLDELPEFRRSTMDALHKITVSKEIEVGYNADRVALPADALIVASMNPCPCGYRGERDPFAHNTHACVCTTEQVDQYLSRVDGKNAYGKSTADLFDMTVEVPAINYEQLRKAAPAESSATIRARVTSARARQLARYGEGILNSDLILEGLKVEFDERADVHAKAFLAATKVTRNSLDLRRLFAVCLTICDLAGSEVIHTGHVTEALSFIV